MKTETKAKIKDQQSEEQIKEQAMKNFAELNGFRFEKDWHSRNGHRGIVGGYYNYEMFKVAGTKRIVAGISPLFNWAESKRIKITSYTISDSEEITIDDLNKVVGNKNE